MNNIIYHYVDHNELEKLIGTYPYYFETHSAYQDLRFPYINFTRGKIVCTDHSKQNNSILSMSCQWDETAAEFYDYYKILLNVTQKMGTDSGAVIYPQSYGYKVFFQPLYAPIHKIKVFEKRIILSNTILVFDGYIALYYGEYACLIGSQDNLSDFINIAFINEKDVDSILQSDIDYSQKNFNTQKTITERIVIKGLSK